MQVLIQVLFQTSAPELMQQPLTSAFAFDDVGNLTDAQHQMKANAEIPATSATNFDSAPELLSQCG